MTGERMRRVRQSTLHDVRRMFATWLAKLRVPAHAARSNLDSGRYKPGLFVQDGIAALGQRPRTTKPAPGHEIFLYLLHLLRGLAIERPNQFWYTDITYIPIGRGLLYPGRGDCTGQAGQISHWLWRLVGAFRAGPE